MFMDIKFYVLEDNLNNIQVYLNTTAVIKHVPDTERKIRIIKEHVRNICNNLP